MSQDFVMSIFFATVTTPSSTPCYPQEILLLYCFYCLLQDVKQIPAMISVTTYSQIWLRKISSPPLIFAVLNMHLLDY